MAVHWIFKYAGNALLHRNSVVFDLNDLSYVCSIRYSTLSAGFMYIPFFNPAHASITIEQKCTREKRDIEFRQSTMKSGSYLTNVYKDGLICPEMYSTHFPQTA